MGKPHGRRRTPGLRLQQRLTPPITTKQPAGPEKPNRNLGASVPSVSVRGSPWAQCPERPHGNLGVRSPEGRRSRLQLRFPIAREFYTRLCMASRTGRLPGGTAFLKCRNRQAARRVVSTGPPACGWLRGTSRTSPGPPRRWRKPVRLQGTSARGRGFAAYLPGYARQLLTVRYAHYAEGASLTTFGFVTIVSRYFAAASNSLTCVRGADRAYCAPRKRQHGLIMRRVKGDVALLIRPKWFW